MPTRYLKDSIKHSSQIDELSWFEEVIFYRLIVTVDDFGRYYGSPIILRNDLFPTKENITKKDIEEALCNLEKHGLLSRYMCDGTPYLCLVSWAKHQKPRATKSRFPDPRIANAMQQNTSADNCMQTPADDGQAYTDVPLNRNRNRNRISESEIAPAHTRGELLPFGNFANVLLSEDEYTKLKQLIPDFSNYLERFSAKIAAKGYHYEDHYAALCAWYADDKKEEPNSSFDVDEFFQAALARTYEDLQGGKLQ